MSVTVMEEPEEPLIHSQFNLPTHQRRLRHLQSITARNLVCLHNRGIDIIKLQVYFTLHQDTKGKAFYTSEKITGSLNPTWQSFDLQRNEEDVDLISKFVVVRVWVGNRSDFQLKIEWHIHLSGLVLFSDKLQVGGLKHTPDTLLIGMYNHIYCYIPHDAANTPLEQLVPDTHVPASSGLHAVLMDQSIVRPSYNTNYLSRIHTVLRAIKQTNASVRRIHSTIEDKLVSSKERSDKLTSREALLIRMRQLRQELLWQQHQKQKEEDELSKQQTINQTLGKRLKGQRTSMVEFCSTSEEKRVSHIQYREMLVKENAQVFFRRRQLISEIIHHIYPIKKDEKEEFYIRNVRLPNAEEYQGHDENMLASALGFVCHLTMMVSQFMDTPLRYPMVHRGSRSLIVDHVHSKLADKDREFPLFGKGKEKFQYNYGVFLLNKNISQMRFYCGLGTSDLRQTLSNLKSLLEQRLGLGPNSPSRGPYTASGTQVTSSLENSMASQMSLPPSSSSSSFIPHNYHHHHHHSHHHHHHHKNGHQLHHFDSESASSSRSTPKDRFNLSALEIQHRVAPPAGNQNQDSPLIFKNSRGGDRDSRSNNSNGGDNNNVVNSNSNNSTTAATPVTPMTSSFSSWIETASKMTAQQNNKSHHHHLKGIKTGNNNDDDDDNNEESTGSKDDDEKEDLFESSEDSFFTSVKIRRPPPTELCHNGSSATAAAATNTSSTPATNERRGNCNTNSAVTTAEQERVHSAFVSTTLSPTPDRSFKLIKPTTQSKDNNDDDVDDDGHEGERLSPSHLLSSQPHSNTSSTPLPSFTSARPTSAAVPIPIPGSSSHPHHHHHQQQQ